MIILDTNVLSELMRPRPSAAASAWIAQRDMSTLYITAVTRAEILMGIALLPTGKRRDGLADAARELLDRVFSARLLVFDGDAADRFADVAARRLRVGRNSGPVDMMIAAIALAHDAAIATRNVADFENCGVPLVNPWEA